MTRTRCLAALLATASCAAPAPGPVQSAEPREGIAVADLDRRVDACTDFYAFANGGWLAAHPIPDGQPRWSRRAAAREENRRRLQTLLEEVAAKPDRPAGSVEKLVGDTYASCMNEAKIDADGIAPLAPLLAEIDGARTPADVLRAIRRLHDIGIPVAFGVSAALDIHEPTLVVASVAAAGLGLPDRDPYLQPDARAEETRARYRVHVAKLLQLRGLEEAAARDAAGAVFALEKRLAEATLDGAAAADPAATDHKMTFAGLHELAPGIDWAASFEEAGLRRDAVNVTEPRFIQALDRELRETPAATWRTYLTFRLLDSAAPFLSRPFADEALAGAEAKPRARRCAEATETLLGDAVGKLYAERYFSPAAQAKVQALAQSLLAVLRADVATAPWMAPVTRKKALEKLATYDVQIGFPHRWKNLSGLAVRRDTLWANVAAARRFNVTEDRRRIGKPADRDLWQLPASSPDAYLDLQLNQIVLPVGFLEARGFRLDASDAVTYGAVGVGLAHDMTHAIDAGGSELDGLGRPRPWWTETDRSEFQQRAGCIVEQFDGYQVEPGLHLQGKLVSSEAIADLAGVSLAYRALQESIAAHAVPTRDGFSAAQQFFIAWAQSRGESARPETERKLAKGDPHPLPRFQVTGTLSNSPEFQRAFSCKPGAAMVRPPEKQCAVW